MKKLLTILVASALLLTGCSAAAEKPKKAGDENVLVHEEMLKNDVELQIYRIAESKLTEEYQKGMSEGKVGSPILAVRYVLTNKGTSPVDIKNVTLWNGNFKNSNKGVGVFNYGEISLHSDLGYPTLPQEFVESQDSTWMLQPDASVTFAYDWLIQKNDLIMSYNIIFPNDKEIYRVEANLSSPKK